MRRVWLVIATTLLLNACAATTPMAPREDLSAKVLDDAPDAKLPATEADGYVNRFDRKLYLVLLDDKTHGSVRGGRSLWALTKALTYTPSNGSDRITVPEGFVTDLASIPRPVWDLLPPDGPWTKAAVIHDFLYYTGGTGVWGAKHIKTITRERPYSRAEADWILRDAMQDRGVDVVSRNIIYLAVRIGGGGGWGH
jgi:hypothetical protein